ncbi:hypothetical protein D9M69_652560 [compost metagenome]
MTNLCAVDEFLDRVTAITLVFPKTQKDIIVSVKNALHFTFLAERLGKLAAQFKARPQQGVNTNGIHSELRMMSAPLELVIYKMLPAKGVKLSAIEGGISRLGNGAKTKGCTGSAAFYAKIAYTDA